MHFFSISRIIILVLSIVTMAQAAFAQNSIGIGTATPAASAQLDVVSTTKGMLVPRVSTAQMNAIASPANGLLVYNTTASAFAYRTASGWVFLTGNATAANGWSTLGNAGTNPATHFIGTTDNQPVVIRQNNLRAGLLAVDNTSWGIKALNPASNGAANTAVGYQVMYQNTTGSENTAMGTNALFVNTTGTFNTANGAFALGNNTIGVSNTAHGVAALFNNITGSFNTALGVDALVSNNTGYSNVAVGSNALFSNTTRSNLVAIGDSALYNNGVGATETYHSTKNTAVGSKALFSNTNGHYNTANGADALFSNTTGFYNTANGADALYHNGIGNFNTANGQRALSTNSTGNYNTATGTSALNNNSSGNDNTALGSEAGFNNQTGNGNIFLGYKAGFNETGSNKLYINNNDGNSDNSLVYGEFDNKKLAINGNLKLNAGTGAALNIAGGGDIVIENDAANGSNLLFSGTNGGGTGTYKAIFNIVSDDKLFTFNGTGGSVTSDARLKQDIELIDSSLDKILQLNGYSYRFISKAAIPQKELGVLAQEVREVLPDLVSTNHNGTYAVSYNGLVPVLINAVKEQQKTIVSQEERIASQEERLTKLEALLKAISAKK